MKMPSITEFHPSELFNCSNKASAIGVGVATLVYVAFFFAIIPQYTAYGSQLNIMHLAGFVMAMTISSLLLMFGAHQNIIILYWPWIFMAVCNLIALIVLSCDSFRELSTSWKLEEFLTILSYASHMILITYAFWIVWTSAWSISQKEDYIIVPK